MQSGKLRALHKPLAKQPLRNPTESSPSLFNLPWDVIESVAVFLRQADLVRLSRTSREFYQIAQPLLWRYPKITDHGPLTLFANYLNRPPVLTVPRVEDWDSVCWDRHMQVKQMTVRLDAGNGLNELASDLLHRIAKHCPDVRIKLFFNGKLGQEYLLKDPWAIFPRVTLIVVADKGMSPGPDDLRPDSLPGASMPFHAYSYPNRSQQSMEEEVEDRIGIEIRDKSQFEDIMDHAVQTMKREFKEDTTQRTMAEEIHPHLSMISIDWVGLTNCVAYAVDLEVDSEGHG